MKLLSVGLAGAIDEVRLKLQQNCKIFDQEGFKVSIDATNKGIYTFLDCNITEGEMSFRNYERIKNHLKKDVADLLADIIISHEEKTLIEKIIKVKYNYFSAEEQRIVHNKAVVSLNNTDGWLQDFNPLNRREKLIAAIMDYLDNYHELVLEGFIMFRLKDYRQKIAAVVDKAIDDHMMDLEYKEFIKVLRYFVDFQEARVEQVHVIFQGNDTYRILDAHYMAINNDYLEHLVVKNTGEISYGDLLISTLITLAPRMLILHFAKLNKDTDFIDTIKNVFEGRVIICEGCEICSAGSMGNYTPNK